MNKIRIDNYNCYAKYNREYATQGYGQKPFKVKLTMGIRKDIFIAIAMILKKRGCAFITFLCNIILRHKNGKGIVVFCLLIFVKPESTLRGPKLLT